MKAFLIALCIILCIIPIIVYGVGIVKSIQMDANCTSYLKMAADANDVKLAHKHLTSAIEYLERNRITSGDTNIFVYKPTNDIGLWYENLKSAQNQLAILCEKEDLTELEESNALMKLRETLCDNEGITHPSCISFYPNHIGWFWSMILIWLLWIGAGFAGWGAYEYDSYSYHRRW